MWGPFAPPSSTGAASSYPPVVAVMPAGVTAGSPREIWIAYLLWFFFGGLGVHRFYLGQTTSAVAMLVLTIVGIFTSIILIGIPLLMAVGVWLLIDIFLIPDLTRQANLGLR